VDCHVGGRSLIRIFLERPQADISLEECAEASRLISPALEGEDLFPGPYDLEVSSPGLDRRLRIRADFDSVVGKVLKLKLTESLEGKGANLTGELLRVVADDLWVKVLGEERRIPLEKVKRANVVWHFE
jgi:ribosome maturation factor RimP